MGTTLQNGVYLPNEGERNCYAGLKTNWEILDQKVADVTALQQAVAGALHREIVESLPTADIDPNTIYMILSGTSATENVYNEFMYVNNAWELIGTSATDLTNYYTKADVDGLLLLKANASDLTSHTGDTTIHVTASDKAKWNTVALIKQLRLVNTQVGSATTIPFSDFDDTNGIKVGDKCMDLDAKMFEITAVDTVNQTVTVGSALIDIALDSNVVHNSGAETISGIKSFADIPVFTSFDGIRFRCAHNSNAYVTFRNVGQTDAGSIILSANDGSTGTSVHLVNKTFVPYNNNDTDLGSGSKSWKDSYAYHGYFKGQQQNDEYSGNARTNLTLLANRDTVGTSGCLIDTLRENTTQGTGMHILGFSMKENSTRYSGIRFQWIYNSNSLGYDFNLKPTTQGSNLPLTYNLGTSADKWDTINGVEPSALGMPDLANGVDISSYITVNGGNKESLYTPPVNGWISVALTRTGGANMAVMLKQGNFASSGHNIAQENGTTTCNAMLPVKGGVQVSINSALADGIDFAYFYPCQGNV